MKIIYATALFLLFYLSQSCTKNNSTPTTNQNDSIQLSVTYADTAKVPPTNFELLIQEQGGKILLDTLSPVNTLIKAILHTKDSLVNVTTVYMGFHDTAYTVNSYLAVNPAGWQTFPKIDGFVVVPGTLPISGTTHETIVRNIPGFSTVPPDQTINYLWFSDLYIPSFLPAKALYPSDNSIVLNGNFADNNYLYSYIPSLGLYNFHVQNWSKGIDTVDLTHMEVTQKVNFSRPAQYGKCNCILEGIMDTTDLSKTIKLYFTSFTHTNAELEYPATLVQRYQLHANFSAPDSTTVVYYSYGKGISPAFLFPDPSTYSIIAAQSDNFSIKFNGLNPSFYETQWKSKNVNFYVFSASAATVQHPQTLLTSLNSQKLKGSAVTALTPVNVQFETVDQMNYASFLNFSSNPSAFSTRRVASAVRLTKLLH